ncbi:hypothetical protein OSB04_023031 [Centaurea solstitialis]|uniref:Uncharacterized protein n=1 Tax=Centaurea solstitialis TaxID=347529 RepID=A0AA38SK21_9ASTR|nr:hypothetical protein OSB04_023031 [Centaurea solstitialis]
MDPNTVVLEISSDEDVGWNDHDHDGSGVADGGDDHNWLSELLDEVSKEEKKYDGGGGGGGGGGDDDEVVVVSEVSPAKKSKSKSKSCGVIDLDDDCVVLDDDPDKPVEVRNSDRSNVDDDSDDICVVSEKGQVACRDYPHPRHLCIKFPFSATPNKSHCEQCYCYVCDSLAPCIYWGNGSATTDHCRATDKDKLWTLERKNAKNVSKGVQPVPNFDFHRPPPPPSQPHNHFSRPRSTLPHHPSANFQTPNIISQNRAPVFSSRNKFHPDLVSQLLLRSNGGRPHHNPHNLNSHIHRPVFKRNGTVGVATTATRPPSYSSYRGSFRNPDENRNYNVNGTLSGSNKYLGSLHLNSVNPSVSYPQSHPMLDQPLPPQPQFSNLPSPNFQSQVNSNPFPENPLYQQPPHLVPSSSRTQPASTQPRYMAPAQSSYPVPVPSQVHIPSIPISDYAQNFQGNQVQNPTLDQGFQDYGLSWSPTENPTTFEGGAATTSEPPLAAVSGGGLADYRYDWIFDNQPVEPGFMDIAGPYGLNELSDSAFIDTGPIFDF